MNTKLIKTLIVGAFVLPCVFSLRAKEVSVSAATSTPSTTYTNHDGATYYNGIDSSLSGDALLSALRSLNKSKRKSTTGYSGAGTSMSGLYRYTDYYEDPSNIAYDNNGQPYGKDYCTSYYSGNKMSSWNREHVWPDSHGGNKVESDIHMPRPTIPSENGSRGNSFYVEGKKSGTNGWDPAMEDFGKEDYRGDSARIIFYCVVADSSLSLVDVDYHSTSRDNNDYLMGKLSDMLKWNLEYPVLQREQNRNEGAEYLQGNRNPFIDHPEYACKIWGNYNDATKKVCAAYSEPPTRITITANETSVGVGGRLTLGITVDKGSNLVNWTSSDNTVATVNGGLVTALKVGKTTITARSELDPTVTDSIEITVKGLDSISVSGNPTKTEYFAGQNFNPAGLTVTATYTDKTTAVVTNDVTWTPSPLYEGVTQVVGTYGGKTVIVSGITVSKAQNYTAVKTLTELEDGDSIVIASKQNGKTAGQFNTKYLESVNSTFTGDEITTLGSGTAEWTLKKNGSSWNFVLNGKKLGTSSDDLAMDTGTTTWNITMSNGDATLKPGNAGTSIRYNKSAPRFKTYKQGQEAIQLYHKAGGSSETINVTGVTLNTNTATLDVGNTTTLVPNVLPANASNKAVTWSTSNTSVATVTSGVVTAVSAGTANITVTTVDGGYTATCTVTVNKAYEPVKVTGIVLDKTEAELQVNDTLTLIASIMPENADNKAITWSTSDETIAFVNEQGVVTALKAGTATITVTTVDGGYTATCNITVKEKQEEPKKRVNCQNSVVAGSLVVAITSLMGLGLLFSKKKHEN